jgi:hypothetical protein
MRRLSALLVWVVVALCLTAPAVSAQTGSLAGSVRDDSGGVLPGVSVELLSSGRPSTTAVTTAQGDYRFEPVAPGAYQIPSR